MNATTTSMPFPSSGLKLAFTFVKNYCISQDCNQIAKLSSTSNIYPSVDQDLSWMLSADVIQGKWRLDKE